MLCNARHVVMYPMAMMMATDTMETMDAMVAILNMGKAVKGVQEVALTLGSLL